MDLEAYESLDAAKAAAVTALVDAVAAYDHHIPLNEEARLLLQRLGARHWLAYVDSPTGRSLVGYAQWQPAVATGQIVVHPEYRQHGIGLSLLSQFPERIAWAFGDLAPARVFAASVGLGAIRTLLVMSRPLPNDRHEPLPIEFQLTTYSDAARDAFLLVNARAFADHPEQGSFSVEDFAARRGEPWWDPEGLLLAWDETGLAGFHWTKVHPDGRGEVYVIGVDPRASGHGLGAALLRAGLDRLASLGCREAILYVEGDNSKARALYKRNGFSVALTDVLYGSLN